MTIETHETLATLAEAQHGAFSIQQALASGVSKSTIWARVAGGLYRQAAQGVLVYSGSPQTWRQQVVVAALSEGGVAAASHRTAAYLHGLVDRPGPTIHIVTQRWLRRRRSDIGVHESNDLTDDDITEIDGIPVTDATRTVVDLGATSPYLVSGALGRALRSRQTDLEQLDSFVARVARRGRRGVGVIRPLIADRRQSERLTESELEDRFMRIVRDFGLPLPVAQFVLNDELGSFVCRADFAYAEARVLIELDGFAHHSDERTFQRDRSKQNRALLLGWSVLRYTWGDVVDRPARIATEISTIVAQ
jgi:very-short-patch-repair endonuclease